MTIHSRRSFLTTGAAALGALAATGLATPALALSAPTVGLRCAHTGRSCAFQYDGSLSSRQVQDFRSVTRDWRANKIYGMDLDLVPLLAGISRTAGSDQTFALISGYRTPATNMKLNGTAKGSLHMKGLAMDIRRGDLSARELFQVARAQRVGGVGYYNKSRGNFVHVDTGRVRYW
jgi:uncharacterized protein YcbK (DUF882 family)